MGGIIERIGTLAGTEAGKAVNLAHTTFTGGMTRHGHAGRAIIETLVVISREHPNLIGIGAGLLVEQLLVEEKRLHEAHVATQAQAHPPLESALSELAPSDMSDGGAANETAATTGPASAPTDPSHPDHLDHHLHFPGVHAPTIRLSSLRPGRVALEVFGALLLIKFGAFATHLFRRKSRTEVWFAPVARIHLLSGTLAAYYFVKSAASPKVSAWRNAAIALFATDALKPVLKHRPVIAPTPTAAPALTAQAS